MNSSILFNNIIRFILLVLFQVILLNKVQYSGYINPYLYVLFILMLPVRTPGWIVLLSSFLIGITVDMFSDTIGLHASASVFMGFIRPIIINLLSPKENFDTTIYPGIKYFSLKWFLTFSLILVISHHLIIFYMEIFSFKEFFRTFLRVLFSSSATLILIILVQYMFYRPVK